MQKHIDTLSWLTCCAVYYIKLVRHIDGARTI
jgi:hypothetical protein